MSRCPATMTVLAIFTATAHQVVADDAARQPVKFHVTSGEDSLDIRLGDQSIATYYFRHRDVTRPFFAHVRTPSGIQVTRNFPPIEGVDPTDHATMHPGIWLAFANINGVNYWHNNDGKIVHEGFEVEPRAGAAVRFATRQRYVDADDREVCRAATRYEIDKVPSGWMLSIDTSLRSEDELSFVVKEEMGLEFVSRRRCRLRRAAVRS